MRTKIQKIQKILETICKHVYFRAPSKGMRYPCIKYDLSGKMVNHADNIKYLKRNQWSITIIDEDPDSDIPETFEETFPYCRFDRSYQADGLNHFVYTLYY